MSDIVLTRDDEGTVLAGEYVLGVLPLPDRTAAERRIDTDRAFAAKVNRWENDLAPFNAAYPEAAAPNLLARIEARLFGTTDTRRGTGSLAWLFRFAGGGAFGAALGLILLILLPPLAPPLAPPVLGIERSATLVGDGQPLVLQASWNSVSRELVVTRTQGTPAPAGQVHQLWVIAGGAAPVPLGLLPGDALVRSLDDLPQDAVLAISLEPAGGSPTGAPTGPVLVTGAVVTASP